LNIIFPYPENAPAHTLQLTSVFSVATSIASNFGLPIFSVPSSAKFVFETVPVPAMPEIAITENGEFRFVKNNIRASRQSFHVNAKTQTRFPQFSTKLFLRSRISRTIRSFAAG